MARVLWIGTFDPGFARNRKFARLLELGGHDVDIVNRSIWGKDRYQIPNSNKVGLAFRAAVAYVRLGWMLVMRRRPDVVLISYPGWFDSIVLGALARLRRLPVVFDVFISLYDTAVSDRALMDGTRLTARALAQVDRASMRMATRVIADTPAHAEYFVGAAGIDAADVDVVWLGADDQVFVPQPGVEPEDDLVVFHGTFIGLQGLETIVRAAKLVEPDGIRVRLVGSGQEQPMVDALVAELGPTNLEALGMVDLAAVPRHIASAALCLGIFGTSSKAGRVIPNKLYECLAVGRPVLTADTPAIGATFDDEVAVVPPGDPEALAGAIRSLLADPDRRQLMARLGHERYLADFDEVALAHRFDRVLTDATSTR